MAPLLRSVVLLAALCLPAVARAVPVLPDFEAATFVPGAPIDNRYFPVLDPHVRVYVSGEGGEDERFELQRTGPGRTLLGVQTTAVRDRAFEGGVLVEDTFDYFAQDTAGNVWYFGEDVVNYRYDDEGTLVGTDSEGSWRAGENLADPSGDPAAPGFIMPADPAVGFEYFQEFAPDDQAVDQARVFSIVPLLDTPLGELADVVQILETNPLEPDDREFKLYAPGRGLVRVEEGLDPSFAHPEARFDLVRVTPVPEPSIFALLAAGVAMVIGMARRRRAP